jgi:uncharacterized membrane protein
MNLTHYKVIFLSVGLIGLLICAIPVYDTVLSFESEEPFTELYFLSSDNMIDNLPYNVVVGQNYMVYLGIGNYQGASSYYACYLKLRNQSEILSDSTVGTPSSLSPIFEHRVVLRDGTTLVTPLHFSVEASTVNSTLSFRSITINDIKLNLDKTIQFDHENKGYYCQLFAELWAFNSSLDDFQYQRCVYFWLNVTNTNQPAAKIFS